MDSPVIPAKAGIHPRANRAVLPNHPHDPLTPSTPAASAARIEGRTQPPHRHSREGGNPSPSRPRRIAQSPHTTRLPRVPPLASAARIEGCTQPPHRHSREGGNPSRADRAVLPHHPHDPLTPSSAACFSGAYRGARTGQSRIACPLLGPLKQGGHDPRRRSELWTKPHGCATVSSGEGAGGWPRPALGRTSWIGGVPFSAQNVTPARYQRHRTAQNDTV